uniref:Protein Wnt n=1 Tax=Platynereis dumerilii TaxID=6359 RepID=E5LCI5_PLADU|nr:wnt signaling molecule [Platynereis dumerilii]
MRKESVTSIIFCSLLLSCPLRIIGFWWALGSPLAMDPNNICRKSRRFNNPRHRQICRYEPDVIRQAVNGVRMALDECQVQFRDRRWNCSLVPKSFNRILRKDTRETAFVYALTAAGVLYSITHACSTGQSMQCSCDASVRDRRNDGSFEWGGCSDNVRFGYQKTRDLLDVVRKRRKNKKGRRKRNDITTLVRMHNNKAGRLAVRNHVRKVCKCHGLSGSCTLETCWLKMPRIHSIGRHLKQKFDGATMMFGSNDGKSLIPSGTSTPPDGEDLVYTTQSPDFCRVDKKQGSLGTHGRRCNPKSKALDGCELMCCGRGYIKSLRKSLQNCQCRLVWCCQVICKTCTKVETIYNCR